MSKRLMILAAAGLVALGCKKEERGSGLPPAQEWNAPVEPGAGTGTGMSDNPHAGMMMGDDPHAGLDMGGDPHGGMGIAEASGMQAPDPHRTIDPNSVLRGVIKASPATKGFIQQQDVIFLSVRPYDPSTQGPAKSPPMAVAKLDSAAVPVAFELSEHDAMVQGTKLVGDVVITAHVSRTHDATTKQPGEVIGMVRATVPADNLELVLDQRIQ